MAGRGPTRHEDHLVPIIRNGGLEQVYWTYSYSPIDHQGGVGGVLVICTETTTRVLSEQRHAAEREALAATRRIFMNAPSFVAVLEGHEHRYSFANDSYLRLVGGRPMQGKTVREALPEIAGQGFYELLDEVYQSGQRHVGTAQRVNLLDPDGVTQNRYVDFVYEPIRDDDEVVTGNFVEGYDVTERVLADKALKDKALELETLLSAVPVAVWFTRDERAEHIEGNCFAQNLLRLPPASNASLTAPPSQKPTGFRVLDMHGEPIDPTELPVQRAARGETIVNFEEELAFDDGSSTFLSGNASPLYDSEGRVRGAIAAFSDITARRDIEEKLRKANARLAERASGALAERDVLARIVETTDAFVQVSDLEFRWLALNNASAAEFERIFGVRPKVGDNMLELLAGKPDQQRAVREVWARALAGEEFSEIGEFGDAAHARRFYEMKFNTLRDADGRIIGAFQFVYDVTRRLEDERRLRGAQEALRQAQKMEAIGQLTGGVAHDFNNLLMAISSGVRMLEQGGDPERMQRVRDGVNRAVERGAGLTRQLLAFSRRKPLEPEVLDVGVQLQAMRELLDRSLRGDVLVEIRVADALAPIEADPGELELAILNLCLNARDAMPAGGQIAIEAMMREGEVLIAVRDDGAGMDEMTRARVFEPFFTTKEIGKGSGLGLAQVYAFMEQSGGAVDIESAVGAGTTVNLSFPASAGLRRTPEQPGAVRVSAVTPLDVLLVEDDAEVASMTEDLLRQIGHSVRLASSARAALDLLKTDVEVDIVVSDVMMPGGMSGVDLARSIKQNWPRLPIILVTGYREAVRDLDADDVQILLKPYTVETLIGAMSAARPG